MGVYLGAGLVLVIVLVGSGRVTWLPSDRPAWLPSLSDVFEVVFWIWLIGLVAIPYAMRAEQTALVRYGRNCGLLGRMLSGTGIRPWPASAIRRRPSDGCATRPNAPWWTTQISSTPSVTCWSRLARRMRRRRCCAGRSLPKIEPLPALRWRER